MNKYSFFINENLSNKKKKIVRTDLTIGKLVKTINAMDGLTIDQQLGVVIEKEDYGYILIEFLNSFSPKLHSGANNIGKDNKCYYVKMDNIYEIIPDALAEKIKNKDVVQYNSSKEIDRIFKRMKFTPSEEYIDITNIDIVKDNMELLSYLPAKKSGDKATENKGRQSMKVGRVLKKLSPKLTDKELENLVTSYWAAYKIIILGEGKNLDVVTGEDIRYWYSNVHYGGNGGELWSSCMSTPNCSVYFNIYCENPDKIGLCIYTNEDDKLMARALVWKLDNGRVYMDRIYSTNYADKKILLDYAEKNNMLTHENRMNIKEKLLVQMPKEYGKKHRPPHGNPYMDTFKWILIKDDSYFLTNKTNDKDIFTTV